MLTLEGVDAFYGDLQALHGVSLEVRAGGGDGLPDQSYLTILREAFDMKGEGQALELYFGSTSGEVFGSLKCECGPQLHQSLELIQRDGGVVIYLRGHEGRGIGLVNKLRAYKLQEGGLDTFDANLALGLPVDSRDYGAAVAILEHLGVASVRLLTNNPEKARQLSSHGMNVSELVPLVVGIGEFNHEYLDTKRDRMGHQLPDDVTHLINTALIELEGHPS